MSRTLQLTNDEALSLIYEGSSDDITVLQDELTDVSRWSTHHCLVVEKDGVCYAANYHQGATEYQDELPFEDQEPVIFREVVPVIKQVTFYEEVT